MDESGVTFVTIDGKPRRLVSVAKACEVLACRKSAVYNMIHRGDVDYMVTPTDRYMIFDDEISPLLRRPVKADA